MHFFYFKDLISDYERKNNRDYRKNQVLSF